MTKTSSSTDSTTSVLELSSGQRRSRFRRRSSIVPDREVSRDGDLTTTIGIRSRAGSRTESAETGRIERGRIPNPTKNTNTEAGTLVHGGGVVGSARHRSASRKSALIPSAIDYHSKQRPRLVFGRRGNYEGGGEFHWPRGLAAMPGGEFAVADSSNHRIIVFDRNGKSRQKNLQSNFVGFFCSVANLWKIR